MKVVKRDLRVILRFIFRVVFKEGIEITIQDVIRFRLDSVVSIMFWPTIPQSFVEL